MIIVNVFIVLLIVLFTILIAKWRLHPYQKFHESNILVKLKMDDETYKDYTIRNVDYVKYEKERIIVRYDSSHVLANRKNWKIAIYERKYLYAVIAN